MKNLFHLSGIPRVMVFMTLLLWPCLTRAVDPKPDETFDFGKGTLGSEVGHDFHLVNAGSSPMTIVEVKTSCPCTRIVSFPKSIAPGQTGVISIDTKMDQAGGKDVLVTAVIDGKAPTHVFAIKGKVMATSPANPDFFSEPQPLISATKIAVLYVDVRPNIAFDEARIPASINMPLFALRARTYLKSRTLIIVGSGVDDLALVSTVEACRKEGFTSIRIMRGGIRQWQQAGGRLEGVFWQKPPLDKMTASELLSSANRASWIILAPKTVKLDTKFDDSIQVKITSYDEIRKIEEISKAALSKNKDAAGVAIFTDSDQDRDKLSRVVPTLDRPVFVVNEPWTAFIALATSQSLERDNATKTVASGPLTHRIIGCPTCP